MAYEYSDGTLAFDLKSGDHITSPNSTLQVWQKVDGQWKAAAGFTMTHFAIDSMPGQTLSVRLGFAYHDCQQRGSSPPVD